MVVSLTGLYLNRIGLLREAWSAYPCETGCEDEGAEHAAREVFLEFHDVLERY